MPARRFASSHRQPGAGDRDQPAFPGTPARRSARSLSSATGPASEGTIGTVMNETDLTADFTIAGIHNHLITGVELDKENADLARFANQHTTIPCRRRCWRPIPMRHSPDGRPPITSQPLTKTATIGVYAVDDIDHQ